MAYGQYQPYMYNPVMSNQYYGNNGFPGANPMNQQAPMMNQQPQYNQMPQQSYQAPQQMQTSIVFVNGAIEARAYPVAPGHRVYMFDTDGRTYYIKAVDFNGMPLPFRTFDSTEIVDPQLPAQSSYVDGSQNINMADYIKRDEVEKMIAAEVEKRLSAMKGGETGA